MCAPGSHDGRSLPSGEANSNEVTDSASQRATTTRNASVSALDTGHQFVERAAIVQREYVCGDRELLNLCIPRDFAGLDELDHRDILQVHHLLEAQAFPQRLAFEADLVGHAPED